MANLVDTQITQEASIDMQKTYIMRNINSLTKDQKIEVCCLIQKFSVLTEVAEGLAINMDNMRPDVVRAVYNLIIYLKSVPFC